MQSLIIRKQATRLATQRLNRRCYSEYKPWSNENSVSGTTCDTMERKVASDNTVDPAKELNEASEEAQFDGREDVLKWSAANKLISDIPDGHEGLWTTEDTVTHKAPSFCHYHPARPARAPIQEGLFKPLKRPVYKRYS
ncbi:hypothetical protein BDB00DRAFT_852755 [Zychaea mexicana]|uniref:uncharacterized protein n=1 Tax=Zychaea mexicana TaxID=64656 RepID=UPI0022FF051F|nr:uncharacterized protein BDB00DRAFT_852755 [Zychaea mexicana]KAI9484901.1 hypothetical protein BDB00DRAFT_852755 [Zychaea mexicana]